MTVRTTLARGMAPKRDTMTKVYLHLTHRNFVIAYLPLIWWMTYTIMTSLVLCIPIHNFTMTSNEKDSQEVDAIISKVWVFFIVQFPTAALNTWGLLETMVTTDNNLRMLNKVIYFAGWTRDAVFIATD